MSTAAVRRNIAEEIADCVDGRLRAKLTEERFESLIERIQGVFDQAEHKIVPAYAIEQIVIAALKPFAQEVKPFYSSLRDRFEHALEGFTASDQN
jgi:hypothetical protein